MKKIILALLLCTTTTLSHAKDHDIFDCIGMDTPQHHSKEIKVRINFLNDTIIVNGDTFIIEDFKVVDKKNGLGVMVTNSFINDKGIYVYDEFVIYKGRHYFRQLHVVGNGASNRIELVCNGV